MINEIGNFLQERITAGDFPSAVYLVAEKGSIVLHGAVGNAVVEPEHIAAAADTIYDLASLTKPLVTALLCAIVMQKGGIKSGNEPATEYLPELAANEKRSITILELLTHTSSLPAWKPLYLCVNDPSEVITEIRDTAFEQGPTRVIYSDLNFVALGRIIENVTGTTLVKAAEELIFLPLGLRNAFFNPPRSLVKRICASEKGNMFERQTCIERGYLEPGSPLAGIRSFRTETIWGEVHDGNAFFMGGAAGHAGLFASAEDVLTIASQFLPNHSTLLTPESCATFSANRTPEMNEHRSFGFQLATTPDSAAGTKMSPESFGHLGFTGTSLWIDPVKERVFILLTNRTHAHCLPFVNLNGVRRRFHEMAIETLERNS